MPISAEMKEYLKGTAFLVSLIKVTALDGTVIAIGNQSRGVIEIDGTTYQPWPFQPTQFQQVQGLSPDNAELATVMVEPFSDLKLRGRKWSGARVEYQIRNPLDLTMSWAFRKVGTLGDLTVNRFSVAAAFRSLGQMLNQPVGEMVMEDCIVVELGDEQCGVNLAGTTVGGDPITNLGSVVTVLNQQEFVADFDPALPDGFFDRGKVIWTSGSNDDLEMHVLKSVGNLITLFVPAYFNLQEADAMTMIAGCDRKRATCRDKFNNVRRFRGYPDLPGRNRVIKFPS